MTSEWLLNMSIEVSYLPKNFYTPKKQIYGYAPEFSAFSFFFRAQAASYGVDTVTKG